MCKRFHCAFAFAIVLTFPTPGNAQTPPSLSPPQVTLRSGVLEGMRFDLAANGMAFLGVPYAAAPVGNLRWKPPEPVAPWHGERLATKFGPACPQLPARWLPYPVWNEDCLFVNIWTTRLSAKPSLPVIVYFHGGSNRAGYSQLTLLGPALSRKGVVVVTANYRLGPFGFLALPALTNESQHHASGNYGLLDQIQVLHWVRDNISNFGGDPAQVTVMGQSAGAVDICLLMASPLANGLFQQAILESGDCQGTLNNDIRTQVPYNEISGTGYGDGQRLAVDMGIADSADALQKLRGIPADTILKAWSHDPRIQFDAIVDGWVVPEQPSKIFSDGRQDHIPVLVGSNLNEATVFGPGPTTIPAYKQYLREDSGRYARQELHVWPVSTDADVPRQYLALQSDIFAYGAWSMARAMTRVREPAYLYLFTWAETGKRTRLGAYHGEELAFLSNSFPNRWGASRDDAAFGKTIRAYWTQFAKTGNPNLAGLPRWPAHNPRSDQVLELGRRIQLKNVNPKVRAYDNIMAAILEQNASNGRNAPR